MILFMCGYGWQYVCGKEGYGGQRSISSLVPQEPLTLSFETSSLTRFWSVPVRLGCLASDPSGKG